MSSNVSSAPIDPLEQMFTDKLDGQAPDLEHGYKVKHLGFLDELKVRGKERSYSGQFLACHAHRSADARAMIANTVRDDKNHDEEQIMPAALAALDLYVQKVADNAERLWMTDIIGNIGSPGTWEQMRDAKNEFALEGDSLSSRMKIMNMWTSEEMKSTLALIFSKKRFDAYQAVAAEASIAMARYAKESADHAKINADSAKTSARATIAIASFTIVIAIATGIQAWGTFSKSVPEGPSNSGDTVVFSAHVAPVTEPAGNGLDAPPQATTNRLPHVASNRVRN